MTVLAPPRTSPPDAPATARRGVLPLMYASVILCVALVAAVNLALPELAADSLRPTSTQLLWTVDAYVIVFACLLIPAGALGDRRGRKGALLTGLGVMAAGCLLSALAPGPWFLVAARALTGAGAALVMPATLSLALQVSPGRRPQTIAAWTAATGVAGMVGNLGGGLVLQYLPWRGLFWCAAPVAAVLLVLTARLAPPGERHPADADPIGTLLLCAGFVALLVGVFEGPERGWDSPLVLGAFAVAAVLLAVFSAHALRSPHPLIDLRLFAIPGVRAGALGVGLTFFGLFALFFVNAQYLHYAKDYGPALTGVAIGPLALGMLIVARRSIGLARRFGTRPLVATGLLSLTTGLALLSLIDRDTPYPLYALLLLVMSVGMGLSMPVLSAGIVGALPPARAGLGSGLNSAVRELGSALGVATMGTALAGTGDFTGGMAVGFRVTAAAVAVLAVPVLLWLRPGTDGRGAAS
ncbi:MFS transporter [Streptomyces sp. RFCAC02]|uniref:MFS transporter n=1 Tax=Streptomyces sp. RFCAC02 TaxID=2499143 RepID=UPI00101F5C75|nr:MFS transporter [Streptomyces sp. RFCAC02]